MSVGQEATGHTKKPRPRSELERGEAKGELTPMTTQSVAPTVYPITVRHLCGHEITRPIRVGTEQVIRETVAGVFCQACRANRVDPIRFASGWGRTR